METPVLLIHFNRPESTRRQIEALSMIAPKTVWLLCDGARTDRDGEVERVKEVRALLDDLPWDCEVTKIYRDENYGLQRNLSEGITAFLDHCEMGIILEDDCIPHASFFEYCSELLVRYADSEDVFTVSGYTDIATRPSTDHSYVFSNYFSCWGWATWKRAWDCYDPTLSAFTDPVKWKQIASHLNWGLRQRLYWTYILNRVLYGKTSSWAYRFQLSIWKHQGLAILPSCNMVQNIGFEGDATNTAGLTNFEVDSGAMDFPLTHPESLKPDLTVNRWVEDHTHSKSFGVRMRWIVMKIKARLSPA